MKRNGYATIGLCLFVRKVVHTRRAGGDLWPAVEDVRGGQKHSDESGESNVCFSWFFWKRKFII